MKKILQRIGLIISFEYKIELSYDSVVSFLTNNAEIKENSIIVDVFDAKNSLGSMEISYENDNFRIVKKNLITPFSGRGQINGQVRKNDINSTMILGEISSNYHELKFIAFIIIFLILLLIPIYHYSKSGFGIILIGTGMIIIVATLIVLFQKFEVQKVKSDFERLLRKISK